MPKKPQIDKFREKARELGADMNEEAFKDALRRVASKDPKERGEALDDLAEQIGQTEPKPKPRKGARD